MVLRSTSEHSPGRQATDLQSVFERCRSLGMRLSRQRRMVLDLLWTERSHLSARDIFEKLNARMGNKYKRDSVVLKRYLMTPFNSKTHSILRMHPPYEGCKVLLFLVKLSL